MKYLEIHFSADRGKSEGCRQKEAGAGLCGAPPSSAPRAAAPRAASPDKSFRGGNIWKFIFRPIEANQRVAGKMKPARGQRRAAVPRPEPRRPTNPLRRGNIRKFISRPIKRNQRVAGKMKPARGSAARRRPARRAARPAPRPHRPRGEFVEPCGPQGDMPPAGSTPSDFPLDRDVGGGGAGVGHGGAHAQGANDETIAHLLEFRKNYLRFLFYRRSRRRGRSAGSDRRLQTARPAPPASRAWPGPALRVRVETRSSGREPAGARAAGRARAGVVAGREWRKAREGAPGRKERVQGRDRRNAAGDRRESSPCVISPIRPRRRIGGAGAARLTLSV
jgi:hypothetical protein